MVAQYKGSSCFFPVRERKLASCVTSLSPPSTSLYTPTPSCSWQMRMEGWEHCNCSLLEPSQVNGTSGELRDYGHWHLYSFTLVAYRGMNPNALRFPSPRNAFCFCQMCSCLCSILILSGIILAVYTVLVSYTAIPISSPAWYCSRDVRVWGHLCIVKANHCPLSNVS